MQFQNDRSHFSKQARILGRAARIRVVMKFFGQLLVTLAGLTIVPFIVSILLGDYGIAWRYGLLVAAQAALGLLLSRVQASARIQTNEALVVVGATFLVAPLFLTFPMTAAGLSFTDALFEAVSAVTTTGLSTQATIEDKPQTFLFARAWTQWYGGLGIVVLSLAFVFRPGVVARRMSVTEAGEEDLVGGMKAHARRALVIYTLITLGGVALLWGLGVQMYHALLYTLSAISTGGFAPHDQSLGGLPGWSAEGVVILLGVLGACSFVFYLRAVRHGWSELIGDLQLRFILVFALLVGGGLMYQHIRGGEMSWQQAARHASWTALSAQTTTGFNSTPIAELQPSSKLLLITSMLIGGGAGSTAGGVKVLRVLLLLQLGRVALARTCVPKHAVLQPRLAGHRLQEDEIQDALLLICLFMIVIFSSWICFVALGQEPLDSLFEVVSASGTVGLSTGVTSQDLPVFLKGVLCIDMLLGRLEIIPLLILFYPRTWFGKRGGSV